MMYEGASCINLRCRAASPLSVDDVRSCDELLLDAADEGERRQGEVINAKLRPAAPAEQNAGGEVRGAHDRLVRNCKAAVLHKRAAGQNPRMASRGDEGGS